MALSAAMSGSDERSAESGGRDGLKLERGGFSSDSRTAVLTEPF